MKLIGMLGTAAASALVADALHRRARLARLPVLAPAGGQQDTGDHVFVTARGVVLDAATRRAAGAHARAEGLGVLDLVPADLDAPALLELARRHDPATFRTARLARGEGARHALLVDRDLAERAGIGETTGLGMDEMDALTVLLKRYCPTGMDLAVAPGLAAVPMTARERKAVLRRRWQRDLPTYLAALAAAGAAIAGYGSRHRGQTALGLAAFAAQPYLATAATPFAGPGRRTPLRPLHGAVRTAATMLAGEPADPALPALRERYRQDLAGGLARFHEPRRADCPNCGGTGLRRFMVARDRLQHRPGTFRYDECRDCGHLFQNPRLSLAGLDFHYRDFYDGIGEAEAERGFRLAGPHYTSRARMIEGHAQPVAWLDVGGGHGHFCNAARDVWPDTTFDMLDMSEAPLQAERQGWADHGIRGLFPQEAPRLLGRYDVISMHHYLEHTIDPWAELDAAATALPPGGHLLIEVPDPQWWLGRILRGHTRA